MNVANIEDLRTLARRRLPRVLFDYIDGGAQNETTLRANVEDYQRWTIRQHVLRDVSARDQSVTVLGEKLSTPLILSPTGMTGLFWPHGALEAARAAETMGAGCCLSSLSTSSPSEVAAVRKTPFWYQLYVMRDRPLTQSLIERAKAAGCSVLVLTVDLAMQGARDRDVHNGLRVPPRYDPSNMWDYLTHPRWVLRYLFGPRPTLASLAHAGHRDLVTVASFVKSQFDQTVSWSDVEWAKSVWGGPMALKGILDADDARRAVDHGADAIIVSNHGGRQLDGVRSAISALPGVADAVKGRAQVIVDGGVRRGSDVIKAIALGATACMIGRPYMYGLAAMGHEGVLRALDMLRTEIDLALVLSGNPKLSELDRSALD
jgi:L-lactate dehydrogenase (cytochrome)